MALSIEIILDRLGGLEAAAKLTAVGTEAVRKWRQTGFVPSRHWPAVIAATGLSIADLQSGAELPVPSESSPPPGATAVLVLGDGTLFWGRGFGSFTRLGEELPSELCFNTAMTGYQETLTDPSYAGQIITFTFPHVGNTGVNFDDVEAASIAARGLVVKQDVTEPANWRAISRLQEWLLSKNIAGISGVDTRAVTVKIRDAGAPNAILCHPRDGKFDIELLTSKARAWSGLEAWILRLR